MGRRTRRTSPDMRQMSGDILPGQDITPPYKGVSCPDVRPSIVKDLPASRPHNTENGKWLFWKVST